MAHAQPGEIVFTYLNSPVGRLLLAGTRERVLTCVSFPNGAHAVSPDPSWRPEAAPLGAVVQQLEEYFAGSRRRFALQLGMRGTAFQLQVWSALADIPYGETRTYGDIARQIGAPSSVRAVGLANGQNPLPIVVPCHRVIGSNGSLTGYGGGLEAKQFLLDLEQGTLFPRETAPLPQAGRRPKTRTKNR